MNTFSYKKLDYEHLNIYNFVTYSCFYLFLISSIFTLSYWVPQSFAYSSAGAFLILFSILSLAKTPQLKLNKILFFLLTAIIIIYSINLFHNNVTFSSIYRFFIFTVTIYVLIFLVPVVIGRDSFFRATYTLSTVLILIGIPSSFLGTITIGIVHIEPYPWQTTLPLINSEFFILRSILVSPNYLGPIAVLSIFMALEHLVKNNGRNKFQIFIILVNIIGLSMTNNRSATAAGFFVLGFYILYIKFESKGVILGVISFTILIISLIFYSIFIGLDGLNDTIDLSNRDILWEAAYNSFIQRPWIGWGTVPSEDLMAPYLEERFQSRGTHNSYVRMFLTSGIIGGTSYICTLFYLLYSCLSNKVSIDNLTNISLLIIIVISQFFASFSIFGLGAVSVIWATTIGYIQIGIST